MVGRPATSPAFLKPFLPADFPEQTLWSLAAADGSLFVGGSFLAGLLAIRRAKLAGPVSFVVLGATAYATLISWSWFVATGDALTGCSLYVGIPARNNRGYNNRSRFVCWSNRR